MDFCTNPRELRELGIGGSVHIPLPHDYFCGYIGVDWGRANQIERTVDNAIDSAAALYLDIINLFLRILRIMSKK